MSADAIPGSAQSRPQLSIVLVNYNTFRLTTQCIRSVKQHLLGLTYEIILVDNASAECRPEKFLEAFPDIKLLALPRNEGFGRGNNAGMKIANAHTLLLLNTDTIIFDDAIERTFHYLHEQPSYGMAGCRLLNEDRSVQTSSGIPVKHPYLHLLINANPFLFGLSRVIPGWRRYQDVRRTQEFQQQNHASEALSGAFMMLKREVLEQCGDFDPDFFMYCEEIEWCKNRIFKKFEIRYFAEAAIVHLAGGSSPKEVAQKQTVLSTFLYAYKCGWGDYFKALIIYTFNTACSFVALPFISTVNRRSVRNGVVAFVKVFPRLLFDIPRFGRGYGSRPEFLIIDEYRQR